jgi:tetratricopeptide (TPR) repeat protein
VRTGRLWNVPFERNPFFTGREDALKSLQETLDTGGEAAINQPQASSGLGGVGKTQTAVEYAYRRRDRYDAIFWIRADTETALREGFLDAARLLGLPEANEADAMLAVTAVHRRLGESNNWLLIYDNADDLKLLDPFLPKDRTGHILITTRSSFAGQLARLIALDRLSETEGAALLLRRSGLRDSASEADVDAARALIREMDGLPLALEQAGAFIEEMHVSPSEYLSLFHEQPAELLDFESDVIPPDHISVFKTFSLSLFHIERVSCAASDLIKMCAFLAPDGVPEELFPASSNRRNEWTRTVGFATRYSLLKRSPESRTLTMHRLAQLVIREAMDKQTRRAWMERAVSAMDLASPDPSVSSAWQLFERLLRHFLVCVEWIADASLISDPSRQLLRKAGICLQDRAQYAEAERCYRLSLAIDEVTQGPEHPDTAGSLQNLAVLCKITGRYEESDELIRRSLAIFEREYGLDHPATALAQNQLAILLRRRGHRAEAGRLSISALTTQVAKLGADHPNTIGTAMNLAAIWTELSQFDKAEDLLQRALEIERNRVPPNLPTMATCHHNLAVLYHRQNKHEAAESHYRFALSIKEDLFGIHHPFSDDARNSLSLLLEQLGRTDEAEEFRRTPNHRSD